MAYRIGRTLGTITELEQLGIIPPSSTRMARTRRFDNASGGYADTGWLYQEWHWGYLTEQQASLLRQYTGAVFVCTLNNNGEWEVYTAQFVWPENEPERYAGHIIGLTILLRNMVYVCKESEL